VSVCVARAERETRDAVAEPLTSGLADVLGEPDARGDAVEDAVALNAADARALGESEKVALGRVDTDVELDARGDWDDDAEMDGDGLTDRVPSALRDTEIERVCVLSPLVLADGAREVELVAETLADLDTLTHAEMDTERVPETETLADARAVCAAEGDTSEVPDEAADALDEFDGIADALEDGLSTDVAVCESLMAAD